MVEQSKIPSFSSEVRQKLLAEAPEIVVSTWLFRSSFLGGGETQG